MEARRLLTRPRHAGGGAHAAADAREPTPDECFRLLRAELSRRLAAQAKWRGVPALIDALGTLRSGHPLASRHDRHDAPVSGTRDGAAPRQALHA